ncbi:MAG: YCF48-related protein [Melioribacteraceae bacterium]|jgi:photosystem II stability/assembly factor-like uncharacterized protein|nr:YCF48-related protein [Melioribacteraceae bacterium]
MNKNFLILLLLTLSITIYASGGWRQVSSATYAPLSDVFFLNENLGWIAGQSGTILRTIDGGYTWEEPTTPLPVVASMYSIFFVNEDIGYAGGKKDVLIKSEDGGETWREVTFESVSGKIYSIYFANENTGWVLSGTSSGGQISYTDDGGLTWAVQATETSVNLKAMSFNSPGHGICVGGKSGSFAFYYTTDGLTWTKAPAPTIPPIYLGRTDIYAVAMASDSVACVTGWGTSSQGLQPALTIRTNNGGETWTYQIQAEEDRLYTSMYGIDFRDELNGISVGYSAYKGSIAYKTIDAGITWKEINFPMGFSSKSISIKNNNICIVGGGGNAIVISNNYGETWELVTEIVAENFWSGVEFISENTIVASGFYGAFLKSEDKGVTWTSSYVSNKNVCPTVRDIYFIEDNIGYTAQRNRVVSKTIDGGNTWKQIMPDTSVKGYTNYGVQFLDENIGFVVGENGGDGAFYGTTNGGENWTLVNGIFGNLLTSLYFSDSEKGVVVGDNVVAFTEDGGNNWTNSIINGASGGNFLKVKFLNSNFGLACGNILIKTIDGGKTWDYLQIPGLTQVIKSCAIVDEQTWYIACDKLVLVTTDGGANWTDISDLNVVTSSQIYDIIVDSKGYPWLACGNSEIYTSSPEVSVKLADGNSPNKFSLEANYPNPFNPSTIINYTLPASSVHNVTLKVYDMLGQEVATLVNEAQKSGTYEVEFNATKLTSGIYIYTLQSTGLLQSRKLLFFT